MASSQEHGHWSYPLDGHRQSSTFVAGSTNGSDGSRQYQLSGSFADIRSNPYISLLHCHLAPPTPSVQYGGYAPTTGAQALNLNTGAASYSNTHRETQYPTHHTDTFSFNGSSASTPESRSTYGSLPPSEVDYTPFAPENVSRHTHYPNVTQRTMESHPSTHHVIPQAQVDVKMNAHYGQAPTTTSEPSLLWRNANAENNGIITSMAPPTFADGSGSTERTANIRFKKPVIASVHVPAAPPHHAETTIRRGKRAKHEPYKGAERSGADDSSSHSVLGDAPDAVGHGEKERGVRLPGACTHCKKLKMKCDFPQDADECKRCKIGGHTCVVEGRKQKVLPNKWDYLRAQLRQKDAMIECLLKQIHNPYDSTPMSIASYRMATSPSDRDNKNVLAWLDRMEATVLKAGKQESPHPFKDIRTMDHEDQSDLESESRSTESQSDSLPHEAAVAFGHGDTQSTVSDLHIPVRLLADMSISGNGVSRRGYKRFQEGGMNDDDIGVANETYFMPGPATDLGIRAAVIQEHGLPEIISYGIVGEEDVENLFDIFYKRINPYICLMDPVLHTSATTFARCPFLFTVICAIASRYYTEKSGMYPIAMHFAKRSAANALIDGWKSVELCQAYILMSVYAVPARRWEEDRSWLYTGLAIRLATDLNLHQASTVKPASEMKEREILNRSRVWIVCYNLDRAVATQFGKPSTIKEDSILQGANDWFKTSHYNTMNDVYLSGHSALLKIVAKFHEDVVTSAAPLNDDELRSATLTCDAELTRYQELWTTRFREAFANDPTCALRCALLPFLVAYSRLVIFSFGFQQTYRRGVQNSNNIFFKTCLQSAKLVITSMVNGLGSTGYLRYAPDGHFMYVSFASAFLLKLLRPEFVAFAAHEQEQELVNLIKRLLHTLGAPDTAVDDRHTPKLYARFLAGMLERRNDGPLVEPLPPARPPAQDNEFGAPPYPQGAFDAGAPPAFDFSPPQMALDGMIPTPTLYTTGPGQLDVESLGYFRGGDISNEEILATMQAIKDPGWWDTTSMGQMESWPQPTPSHPLPSAYSGHVEF